MNMSFSWLFNVIEFFWVGLQAWIGLFRQGLFFSLFSSLLFSFFLLLSSLIGPWLSLFIFPCKFSPPVFEIIWDFEDSTFYLWGHILIQMEGGDYDKLWENESRVSNVNCLRFARVEKDSIVFRWVVLKEEWKKIINFSDALFWDE